MDRVKEKDGQPGEKKSTVSATVSSPGNGERGTSKGRQKKKNELTAADYDQA